VSDGTFSVFSNTDGHCSIFELNSGKQIVNNLKVIGNNSSNPIIFRFDNIPYLIQFVVDGQIHFQQPFIFFNNSLFKGGL